MLGEKILEGANVNRAWNFGPDVGSLSVLELLTIAHEVWPKINWTVDNKPTHPHMVYLLKIDSTEARKVLGWRPQLKMEEAVEWAIDWYREYYENGEILTDSQITAYEMSMEMGQ